MAKKNKSSNRPTNGAPVAEKVETAVATPAGKNEVAKETPAQLQGSAMTTSKLALLGCQLLQLAYREAEKRAKSDPEGLIVELDEKFGVFNADGSINDAKVAELTQPTSPANSTSLPISKGNGKPAAVNAPVSNPGGANSKSITDEDAARRIGFGTLRSLGRKYNLPVDNYIDDRVGLYKAVFAAAKAKHPTLQLGDYIPGPEGKVRSGSAPNSGKKTSRPIPRGRQRSSKKADGHFLPEGEYRPDRKVIETLEGSKAYRDLLARQDELGKEEEEVLQACQLVLDHKDKWLDRDAAEDLFRVIKGLGEVFGFVEWTRRGARVLWRKPRNGGWKNAAARLSKRDQQWFHEQQAKLRRGDQVGNRSNADSSSGSEKAKTEQGQLQEQLRQKYNGGNLPPLGGGGKKGKKEDRKSSRRPEDGEKKAKKGKKNKEKGGARNLTRQYA